MGFFVCIAERPEVDLGLCLVFGLYSGFGGDDVGGFFFSVGAGAGFVRIDQRIHDILFVDSCER